MGLSDKDKIKENISLKAAYCKIKKWYQSNIHLAKELNSDYGDRSVNLIDNLPECDEISNVEIRAILEEVIWGYLEWGYHKKDRYYKMAAYAHGAFESNNISGQLNDNEKKKLEKSQIWQFLTSSKHQ